MTRLLAVYNGGGRPGRIALDFKDAIAPVGASPLCRALDEFNLERACSPLVHFAMMGFGSMVERVFENNVETEKQVYAWRKYFPSARVFCGSPIALAVDDAYKNGDLGWMWRRIARHIEGVSALFDLIVDHRFSAVFLYSCWHLLKPSSGLFVVDGVTLADMKFIANTLADIPALRGVLVELDSGEGVLLLERYST